MTCACQTDTLPRCGHPSELMPRMRCANSLGHPEGQHYYVAANGSHVVGAHGEERV